MSQESAPKRGTDIDTVSAYNKGAAGYETRYEAIGARVEDIERGFSMQEERDPFVVEIGCGNARDAKVIVGKAGKYIGLDVSHAMLEIARKNIPDGTFVEADVMEYEFPNDVNIVFAFASLLHLDQSQLRTVLEKVSISLSNNGILYLSLKHKDVYSDEIVTDEYGSRHFYYYSHEDINEILPDELEEAFYEKQFHGRDDWMTIVLRKKSG